MLVVLKQANLCCYKHVTVWWVSPCTYSSSLASFRQLTQKNIIIKLSKSKTTTIIIMKKLTKLRSISHSTITVGRKKFTRKR